MAKIILPPYFEDVVNAGEQRLIDFLEHNLADDYYLIPNVEIASTNPRNNRTQYWEYDLIVVAPHAIYNIENKDWRGRIEGDDNYWYVNDRQRNNPLKTGRQKTAILASKLKEYNPFWGKAWVQNMVTLSFPNAREPQLWQEAGKLTFQLDAKLIKYIDDPYEVGKSGDDIASIQEDIVNFFAGVQSKKSVEDKREVEGYEIIEVLQQEQNFTEYLVKPKGVTSSIRKRVKEFSLQIAGLSETELKQREESIKNQYNALNKIKAKPFILNVEFRIDEENHLFYEISDFLDENSLRAEARSKTFTLQEKIDIIKNVIAALKEAHKESIYHRDVNPDNIFMSSGYAYLGNFGKSYFIDHHEQGYTVMATINEMNATPYHPLELTVGDASKSSDMYSLGVLIYWLFVGEEPFKTPYELDKIGGQLTKSLLPSNVNSANPKWLDEICLKTILSDDLKRIEDIKEVEKIIQDAFQGQITQSTNTPIPIEDIPSDELKEGDRIGSYVIHQVLGKGGYSKVFKVKHGIQDKYYTMKLFHQSVIIDSVRDEYTALTNLDHKNIVKFKWNDVTSSGQFYTIMEYLDGENLSNYINSDIRLPIVRIYQLAKNILEALVSMQTNEPPILHRDIKPQNIIWDNNERFVLIDFNVASFVDDNQDFVGTNPYLPPDIIADNYKVKWNTSVDPFALGITVYELLCKQYPWFPKKVPMQSIAPTSPKEVEGRISNQFSEFILKAINPNTGQRFNTAQEMLDALESIGEHGLLEENKIIPRAKVKVDEGADYVAYINSLYSQSKSGNTGTRANFEINAFDDLTYTPTKLDEKLIPAVLDGQFKLLIITGNAGDGKTAFIRKIEDGNGVTDLSRFNHKNGAKFKINGVSFESNYDGSQDEDEKANNAVLEEFFSPFENLDNYNESSEGRVIAINEGRLVEFLKETSKHKNLHDTIENYFYNEGHQELPEGVMIINLNLRSVSVQGNGEKSLFRKQLKSLTQKELWSKCDTCSLANKCFIKYNVGSYNDTATGDEVISRMEWLIKTASLKRELHITMRDLRSLIAYMLTRDYHCDEIEELHQSLDGKPEAYWQYYYFNLTSPYLVDSGNQDRLIKLLRETDIGEVSIPDLDRDLFFGKHLSQNYIEFAERKISLLDSFNQEERILPSYEQDKSVIDRIKVIHKTFIRHQYFEGKVAYKKRLPYHSIFDFVKALNSEQAEVITLNVLVANKEGITKEIISVQLDKESSKRNIFKRIKGFLKSVINEHSNIKSISLEIPKLQEAIDLIIEDFGSGWEAFKVSTNNKYLNKLVEKVSLLILSNSIHGIKLSLSKAISKNEGCNSELLYRDSLVLASSEIKDPLSKSFRLFSLDDFELSVNRTDHLINYLEYEPDSLTFRHKREKHISLTISLDLFEMLYFIQQGFSPSLNDLKGKFIELVIFKNLLENLTYNEVVVTKDNIKFFKIQKDGNSKLHIQPMEIL